MCSLCGMACCEKCPFFGNGCDGCAQTGGHPCGGSCFAAELFSSGRQAEFNRQKQQIVEEINALSFPELHVTDMNLLIGAYVNLEYPLPNGKTVQLLQDNKVYFGNQIEHADGRCYGVVADETHLLVCTYGCDGADPEIVLYRKR